VTVISCCGRGGYLAAGIATRWWARPSCA
jgi:hypothetical protein